MVNNDARSGEKIKLNNTKDDEFQKNLSNLNENYDYDEVDDEEIEINVRLASIYSRKYRILKTFLMFVAWISLGLCAELYGPSMEDLRIQLTADYREMSRLMISRFVGYIITTIAFGFVFKKLVNVSDILVAISKMIIGLAIFGMPLVQNYTIMLGIFFAHGMAQAIYDVVGSTLVFKLWSGISDSAIGIVYSGYSVGGALGIVILKPFIRFNPIQAMLLNNVNQTLNSSTFNISDQNFGNITKLTPNDIRLHIPYSIAGAFSLLIAICCFIAYFFEVTNTKKYAKKNNFENNRKAKNKYEQPRVKRTCLTGISRLLFDQEYSNNVICIKLLLFFLIILVGLTIGAFYTVNGIYQFTYLTEGPAKLAPSDAMLILTSMWAVSFLSRLICAFIGFKVNSLVFFFVSCFLNFVAYFLTNLPQLNSIQLFHWIILFTAGIVNAPLVPGLLMASNYVLTQVSSSVLSFILMSLTIGGIGGQFFSGLLLDIFKPEENWFGYTNPKSQYLIPTIITVPAFLMLLLYIIIIFVHLMTKSKK